MIIYSNSKYIESSVDSGSKHLELGEEKFLFFSCEGSLPKVGLGDDGRKIPFHPFVMAANPSQLFVYSFFLFNQ